MVTTSPPALRVAFFGTPDFAVPVLEALLASRHPVTGVVTQPDRPRGRGHRISFSPVKDLARARGLPVLQPTRLKDTAFLEAFEAFGADIGVVAAYGRILPPGLLERPRLGLINVHASLLPKYRGAAPVHRAVMAGEQVTGVTIMRVVAELDAGPILAAAERPIGLEETSAEVERALAALGAPLLIATIERLAAGSLVEVPQDPTRATYAPRISREDGPIDWTRPAFDLHNQIRGLHPWPHASSFLENMRCLLLRSLPGAETLEDPSARPGDVMAARGSDLAVCAGDRRPLRILQIQPEGRRPMSAREFLAGHRLPPGARFRPGPSA